MTVQFVSSFGFKHIQEEKTDDEIIICPLRKILNKLYETADLALKLDKVTAIKFHTDNVNLIFRGKHYYNYRSYCFKRLSE